MRVVLDHVMAKRLLFQLEERPDLRITGQEDVQVLLALLLALALIQLLFPTLGDVLQQEAQPLVSLLY